MLYSEYNVGLHSKGVAVVVCGLCYCGPGKWVIFFLLVSQSIYRVATLLVFISKYRRLLMLQIKLNFIFSQV